MNDANINDQYIIPPLMATITTYEKQPNTNIWKAVISHSFHADTQEELFAIINAHKQTDSFFNASECGLITCEFAWKGGKIYLRNSEPKVVWP